MAWAKLDDRYDDNPKMLIASRRNLAACAIHAFAISYSSRHLTDGFVPAEWLQYRFSGEPLDELLGTLVECGLFEPVEGGFLVHDYLDFNPSKTDVQERLRVDAERKKRVRSESNRTRRKRPSGVQSDGVENVQRTETNVSALPARAPAQARARTPIPSHPLGEVPA